MLVDALDDHMGGVWEAAFRDHLRRMAREGRLGADIVVMGPYWSDDSQTQIEPDG